ncbi:MAG: hypothetical protein K5856_07890 [Bacteroidaceae bacterium]|nr:hypothetical protein [Bacteroidaceae bacterium]
MKAVRYPTDPTQRVALKNRYVAALGLMKRADGSNRLKWCQKEWRKIRRSIPQGSHFPSDIRKVLKAEYPKLVVYYLLYRQVQSLVHSKVVKKLYEIFSYSACRPIIAHFFMDSKNGFNLGVCHYCGTAYINKYIVKGDQDGLDIINNASVNELGKLLHIKTPTTLQFIDRKKPYMTVAQFNSVGVFRCSDKFHTIFPQYADKNHFDLDHVLDKGNCPITAISLMNFVPSCSVCNEKLKKQKVLGVGGVPSVELSPSSRTFDFDRQVEFMLIPKAGKKIGNRPTRHADDYDLEIVVKKPAYDIFVELFHLRERYEFHKMEGLFWLELKYRYTDSRIAMMANSLHDADFSVRRIKDDIFQRQLDERERCFEKLKRDILK